MSSFVKRYEKCFRECKELPALTDRAAKTTYSYLQLAALIDSLHTTFRENGIEQGDKIALIGKNSPEWVAVYMSVMTYGAIIVPILSDFNPIDVVNIINHSDSKLLFGEASILEKLDKGKLVNIKATFSLNDLKFPSGEGFDIEKINYFDSDDEGVAEISYTSGTTGTSKGVMLPFRSLENNVQFALDHNFHFRGSRVLALLPFAHAYGCAFDLLTPLTQGSHIYLLGKIPSPAVMMEALNEVKPHLICTVPLVMEKIVSKIVMPKLKTKPMNFLLKIPFVNNIIYSKVRETLVKSFGGNLLEMNMGGAALSPETERFLKKIHFPFTVGYGMTETGPLISYDTWRDFRSGSCGTILTGMEVKIEKENPDDRQGEVCVRGLNVMKGYYKNPEATAAAIQDGWLHTGDVGYIDSANRIYLRGRCKTMILTSSGQNIYPEEIEAKLNTLAGVAESLVYEENGKLFALVYPEKEPKKIPFLNRTDIESQMKANLATLNTMVAPYEKISDIIIVDDPFEKTPKQSIKRFLYPAKIKAAKK